MQMHNNQPSYTVGLQCYSTCTYTYMQTDMDVYK